MRRVAVIGAGLAGCILADRLSAAGQAVTLFEKSRGTGGRIASTRLDRLSVDLGAPFIEAQSAAFKDWLAQQSDLGRLHRWAPRRVDFNANLTPMQPVWVAEGRNSALTRALIQNARLQTQTRIGVVWPDSAGVLVRDSDGCSLGHFDAVISTVPAPQAILLLEAVPRFAQLAQQSVTDATFVYLARLSEMPDALQQADIVEGGHPHIARILVESNKPSRDGTVVKVEMQRDWSDAQLNQPLATVQTRIKALLESWLQQPLVVTHERTHRWLYHRCSQVVTQKPMLWDPDTGIGACGDWLGCADFEGSFASANLMADRLLEPGRNAA